MFLPGIVAIEDLYADLYTMLLEEEGEDEEKKEGEGSEDRVELAVVHGHLEKEDQERAVGRVGEGKMRVVLATNIAESSVTIPDVKYVLDFGLQRQVCLYILDDIHI